ncbi:hypothetical protein Bca4012_068310 [Brassica carinata]
MNQPDHSTSSAEVEKPPQGPYTSPPPLGYPTRDAMVGDPPAGAVETKSKGDGFWKGWYINILSIVFANECCIYAGIDHNIYIYIIDKTS